jgi:hypothetical protein
MKGIADACEAEGATVERVWCSSDADSLDGVYICDTKTLFVDGTAPHVLEPVCPGAGDGIINFGDCWNESELADNSAEIRALQSAISEKYTDAYSYLAAAGEYAKIIARNAEQYSDSAKLLRRAAAIPAKYIPVRKSMKPGVVTNVFLDALTPTGANFLGDFADWEVCQLHDCAWLYPAITAETLRLAVASGYDAVASLDPLFPEGAPLHVIIPELRFALLTSGLPFGCPGTDNRRVRIDMLLKSGEPKSAALARKENMSRLDDAVGAASAALNGAKLLHDDLEKIYMEAIDFSKVDVMAAHCRELALNAIKTQTV